MPTLSSAGSIRVGIPSPSKSSFQVSAIIRFFVFFISVHIRFFWPPNFYLLLRGSISLLVKFTVFLFLTSPLYPSLFQGRGGSVTQRDVVPLELPLTFHKVDIRCVNRVSIAEYGYHYCQSDGCLCGRYNYYKYGEYLSG